MWPWGSAGQTLACRPRDQALQVGAALQEAQDGAEHGECLPISMESLMGRGHREDHGGVSLAKARRESQ